MVNEKMRSLGATRSAIRDIFEYGKIRKAQIGEENVFDFSLGNPSVPSPKVIEETLQKLLMEKDPVALHGYTSAQGDRSVREALADYTNKTYGDSVGADSFYLTAGAAASLTISLTAVLHEGDEVILLAPFFPEYRVFVERTGAKGVPVMCDRVTFQPDIDAIEAAITEKTRAMIVNSPNNPTGVVITKENAEKLSSVLLKASETNGNPIYLISDEPYRELVYGDVQTSYFPAIYPDCLVCYSFSKSLSLPGERIGYILVSPRCTEADAVYEAVCGAGRALGFVCAPTLFQHMIPSVLGKVADISVYDTNRRLLYDYLSSLSFDVIKPDGAFYLFLKAPRGDANEFVRRAKEHELLLVPSDSFGCEGYVRISYCVKTEQIKRSLDAFRALADSYK